MRRGRVRKRGRRGETRGRKGVQRRKAKARIRKEKRARERGWGRKRKRREGREIAPIPVSKSRRRLWIGRCELGISSGRSSSNVKSVPNDVDMTIMNIALALKAAKSIRTFARICH